MGIRGKDVVVLAVEKKNVAKLQDPRPVKKIVMLDEHICVAFAGLNADARVLINKALVECQSHRLSVEDPVTIEYISRYVAGIQQKYTQKGGVRPFGVCLLLMGFDTDHKPRLFLTEPSGIDSEWTANAIGRGAKTVREYLEKTWAEGLAREDAIKLAIQALLEVVQTGASSMEIAVMTADRKVTYVPSEQIQTLITDIERERQAEAERKRTGTTSMVQ